MDYKDENIWLMRGDCLERMKEIPSNSVDSIVTDPPYGLSFMGKKWDYDVPSVEIWQECLRVLKPGGHLLAFSGSRTYHRMAVNIEEAGLEIRDQIMWVYGSGFPKSMDVRKAIDKAAGAERKIIGKVLRTGSTGNGQTVHQEGVDKSGVSFITAPTTEKAKQWEGWGTALKPAHEPIVVARKPLVGTVAANVLEHGTGALNIDGCRVATRDDLNGGGYSGGTPKTMFQGLGRLQPDEFVQPSGRWPANLIHDGSDEVLGLFPVTGASKSGGKSGSNANPMSWDENNATRPRGGHDDFGGSAARFFYCAKASKKDRDEGLKEIELTNSHPTVKPTELMAYLCRLITKPNGAVLDPFMGSGSTGKAAIREHFCFIGIELDQDYFEIAKNRILNRKNLSPQ